METGREKVERRRESKRCWGGRARDRADARFLAGSNLPASSRTALHPTCYHHPCSLSCSSFSASLVEGKKVADTYTPWNHTRIGRKGRSGRLFSPPDLPGRSANWSSQVGDRVLLAWPSPAERRRKRPSLAITQIALLRVMTFKKNRQR